MCQYRVTKRACDKPTVIMSDGIVTRHGTPPPGVVHFPRCVWNYDNYWTTHSDRGKQVDPSTYIAWLYEKEVHKQKLSTHGEALFFEYFKLRDAQENLLKVYISKYENSQ